MRGHREHRPFPGDHAEKRAARLFIYKHALSSPRLGHAVTLAGNTPDAEIELLRDYLRWPADRVWFVDSSKNHSVKYALIGIKCVWNQANVYKQDLRKLLPNLDSIGFANLDFMGAPLQKETLECFQEVNKRLLPGAIVGFTWFRGREYPEVRESSRLLYELGKGYEGNERRWMGVMRAVENFSKGTLRMIDRYEYRGSSCMAVSIFRKEQRGYKTVSRSVQA